MVMCWAPACRHYNQRELCKFFRFPKAGPERRKWQIEVRRDNEPGPGAFLCSCHFKDGKRENGPTIFDRTVKKSLRLKALRRKREPRTVRSSASTELDDRTACLKLEEHFITYIEDSAQPSTSIRHQVENADLMNPSIMELQVANCILQKRIDELEKRLSSGVRFTYYHIKNNDELIKTYTGLPNGKLFEALYNLFKENNVNYRLKCNVDILDKRDQLLLCLIKLRQNFLHVDLAQKFQISLASVTHIVIAWIPVLHNILYKQLLSAANPNSISTFANCRIILDCTDMANVTSRTSVLVQNATCSNYKHGKTWKALVGIAPNGLITYASGLYPESTSDKTIVKTCGVLDIFEKGDLISADKGFLIEDIVAAGVNVNIPPVLITTEFISEQIHEAPVHVERAIRRIKCFQILSFMPYKLLRHADAIFQIIAALTNLQNPFIKEVKGYIIQSTVNY